MSSRLLMVVFAARAGGLVGMLALAGCATTKNYGAGSCTEYRPLCMAGHERCSTDSRGCTQCTCDAPPDPQVPGVPPREL